MPEISVLLTSIDSLPPVSPPHYKFYNERRFYAIDYAMKEMLQLLTHHSTPARLMTEPAPDSAQLRQIFEIAMTAPDHGRLHPYRFLTIRGDARYALSQVFGEAVQQRDPVVSDEYLQKQKDKPLRAPLIVIVIASLIESRKIPAIEQMLCAGAAAHNILLACNAMGFGSIWLTGDNAYDNHVKSALGLAGNEHIVGFLYIGTELKPPASSTKPNVEEKISEWL